VTESYTAPDLLIIDNMCCHDSSENAQDIIYNILNDRTMVNKPTICISFFDESVMRQYMTDAGYSRALNGGFTLTFTGRNRRNTY
jgi:DNA replication protein DnaC